MTALRQRFADRYGRPAHGVWSAPGRVNLIGEHTDYNGGLCLPIALPHSTFVAVAPRTDDFVTVRSMQDPASWQGRLADIGPGRPAGWAGYAAGVAWAMARDGTASAGLDLLVDGHVPVGAGLSSSAALECAVAIAVDDLGGGGRSGSDTGRAELAAACVEAENVVVGAPTGGMDQAAALRCVAAHALLLDTRDGTVRQVRFDPASVGLALLVIDTRTPHTLVDGQYAARRRTCEQAARQLGVPTLREVVGEPLDDVLARLADDVQRRRVRHVLAEIARVEQVVAALDAGEPARLGPIFDASHASMRDDYEISCRQLDLTVGAATASGALGARMTGGGFGGSAIALVELPLVLAVANAVANAFADAGLPAPRFLLGEPSAAARRLE